MATRVGMKVPERKKKPVEIPQAPVIPEQENEKKEPGKAKKKK